MSVWEWLFVAEYGALFALRVGFARNTWAKPPAAQYIDATERVLMLATLVGVMILPVVYFCTPWLNFADYSPPTWLGWLAVPIAPLTVWLFWRAHADLSTHWSPTLEVRQQHEVVTAGVYRWMRHPMYASAWLWAISQALLVPNWIAGLAGLATFAPMYLLRVPREERMMLAHFGDTYARNMAGTPRMIPRYRASSAPPF